MIKAVSKTVLAGAAVASLLVFSSFPTPANARGKAPQTATPQTWAHKQTFGHCRYSTCAEVQAVRMLVRML